MSETIIIGGRTNKTTTTLKEILKKKEKEEFAIAELEKVKEKIFNKQDEFMHSNLLSDCSVRYGLEIAEIIIDKDIEELKGENK